MSIQVGSQVTFAVRFTDGNDSDADPDQVELFLKEHVDGTELYWLYDASPVEGTHYPTDMNPIVKDSTGDYHLAWIARKPERISVFWAGEGTIYQTESTTVFVRHSPID